MKIKDYFLSQEVFEIKDSPLGIKQTYPIPSNLEKYYESEKYISHTDEKKSIFSRVYQIVKKWNLKNKKNIILKYKQKGKLLDYGCGVGDFIFEMKNQFIVEGYEPNNNAAKIAENKIPNAINTFKHLNQIQNETYDVITLWHVLEHIPNLEETLEEFKRILKNTGIIIIAVPNYKSYDAKYYKEYWAAYDVPRHIWHFDKTTIEQLFKLKKLSIINKLGMKFDSYYVSILSEKYKNNNLLAYPKGILIGLLSNLKAKKTNEYSSMIYIFNK